MEISLDLLLAVIVSTLIVGLAMPLGAAVALFENIQSEWLREEFRHRVMAFGGGALLSAIALVLVPEGMENLSPIYAASCFVLGGYFFMALDVFLYKMNTPAGQLAAMLSDFIPESIALGAAFATGDNSAYLLAGLIGLQNLPEGFNAYRELNESRTFSSRKIITVFILMALLGPVAGVSGLLFLADSPVIVSAIMLFAAGGILYSIFQDIAPPQVKLEKNTGGHPWQQLQDSCWAWLDQCSLDKEEDFMDKASKIHLLFCGALVVTSVLSLMFKWHSSLSGIVVILTNGYLLAVLIESASRAGEERKIKDGILLARPAYYFPFPAKPWLGVLILFIVITTVFGFANMYIASAEVIYVGPSIDALATSTASGISIPPPSILEDKIEALYFSLVTMITLGYGDFVPATTDTRLLVMWQLATGGLLVIGVFPLIVARVADF